MRLRDFEGMLYAHLEQSGNDSEMETHHTIEIVNIEGIPGLELRPGFQPVPLVILETPPSTLQVATCAGFFDRRSEEKESSLLVEAVY